MILSMSRISDDVIALLKRFVLIILLRVYRHLESCDQKNREQEMHTSEHENEKRHPWGKL